LPRVKISSSGSAAASNLGRYITQTPPTASRMCSQAPGAGLASPISARMSVIQIGVVANSTTVSVTGSLLTA